LLISLLDHGGLDINARDMYNNTPLFYAAEKGRTGMVSLFLSHDGVDADCRCIFKRTPLWIAVDQGHVVVAQTLSERSDVDSWPVDRWGQTTIARAAAGVHTSLMRLTLPAPVEDEDAFFGQALALAAAGGRTDSMTILFEQYKAPVSRAQFWEITALGLAADGGHDAAARLLLSYGADLEPFSRRLYDHMWRTGRNFGSLGLVRWILKSHTTSARFGSLSTFGLGGEPRTSVIQSWSPLYVAVEKNHRTVVKILQNHSNAGLNDAYCGGTLTRRRKWRGDNPEGTSPASRCRCQCHDLAFPVQHYTRLPKLETPKLRSCLFKTVQI
jgi:ankyrin repeat protein